MITMITMITKINIFDAMDTIIKDIGVVREEIGKDASFEDFEKEMLSRYLEKTFQSQEDRDEFMKSNDLESVKRLIKWTYVGPIDKQNIIKKI